MPSDAFYQTGGKDIVQGDIFDGVPHLFLRPPLHVLRRVTLAGGREAMGFYQYPPPTDESPGGREGKIPPGGPFHLGSGEQASSFCQVSRAIVLNHDCDIENEPEHRLVALVRPLAPVRDAAHQEVIRLNQNYSYFYLPAEGEMPDAYVDFRRITSLTPDFLSISDRLSSLSEESVKALQFHLFRFLTRRDIGGE